MSLNIELSEACILRHVINEHVGSLNRMINRYQRYTVDNRDVVALEDFYARLSQLESSKKKLVHVDELLSDYIGEKLTMPESAT